jgi:DNA-binding protein HU-beta
MTKQELVQTVAEMNQDTPKARVERIIGDAFNALAQGLQKGERVSWPGFGSFEQHHRKARQGRNPQTGETIQIAASNTVKFKVGKKLKDSLNS